MFLTLNATHDSLNRFKRCGWMFTFKHMPGLLPTKGQPFYLEDHRQLSGLGGVIDIYTVRPNMLRTADLDEDWMEPFDVQRLFISIGEMIQEERDREQDDIRTTLC